MSLTARCSSRPLAPRSVCRGPSLVILATSSLPFILGFTVIFVLLGAGAAAVGSAVDKQTQLKIAGFVLVVLGLAFLGLLPLPERTVAPGLLQHARRRGSGAGIAL